MTEIIEMNRRLCNFEISKFQECLKNTKDRSNFGVRSTSNHTVFFR